MVKSNPITIDAAARAIPLGGAHGFALSAMPGESGQTWPVAVSVRTATGAETQILAREGVWYALGEPAVSALARLPPGAAAASYLLDVALQPDAAAVPATATAEEPPAVESQVIVAPAEASVEGFQGAPWDMTFDTPRWARALSLYCYATNTVSITSEAWVRLAGEWFRIFTGAANGGSVGMNRIAYFGMGNDGGSGWQLGPSAFHDAGPVPEAIRWRVYNGNTYPTPGWKAICRWSR